MWGLNSRLDNLQAGDPRSSVQGLRPDHCASPSARLHLSAGAWRSVPSCCCRRRPEASPDHFDVFQNYEIEAERRDELKEFLKLAGIGTLIQWGGKAVHQFAGLGLSGTLPRTELLFQRCLMLPMNMMVTLDDARHIAAKVREFYHA